MKSISAVKRYVFVCLSLFGRSFKSKENIVPGSRHSSCRRVGATEARARDLFSGIRRLRYLHARFISTVDSDIFAFGVRSLVAGGKGVSRSGRGLQCKVFLEWRGEKQAGAPYFNPYISLVKILFRLLSAQPVPVY